MLDLELLKLYDAKSDGTTIYQHNLDLINILKQLNISKDNYFKMIRIIEFHDVGKVINQFQESLNYSTNKQIRIRHEIISASIKDLDTIERIAIITHHKNLEYMYNEMDELLYNECYGKLYIDQLREIENKLNIETLDIRDEILEYERKKYLLKDKQLLYLKGILNYCDHLASAGVIEIQKGIDIKDRYRFDSLTSIQIQAKNEDDDILIFGATGSGKTEAGLLWSHNIDKNKDKKLFYILPFTASINAMYKRLKSEKFDIGMLHSKAQYFLSKELSNDSIKFEYQMFKYFTKTITVSTMHQVFKAMFNCKFNEMMLSVYKNSIFIIDEIHCFDEKELAILLNTLKYLKDNFNIRICIMSASIPTILLNLIKEELCIDKVLRMSYDENNKIKRHKIYYKEKYIEDDIENIKECYEDNKSLIICTNTVKKAQDMYESLKAFVDIDDIILLHSAFNQRDRERIEKQIHNKKVLVGTQAIEVSLDIDFDEMFTEISPIDSQIQRWGRVNRKRTNELVERKRIFIYNNQSKIYNKDIIKRTKKLLISIENIDENKVQEYLDQVYIDDFIEYYEYKEICKKIFEDIQVAKWDNRYNEIASFTGTSVLPSCFIDEYEDLIEQREYLRANSLMVNISENKYRYAVKENAIDECNFIYYDYNSEVGLKFGEVTRFL